MTGTSAGARSTRCWTSARCASGRRGSRPAWQIHDKLYHLVAKAFRRWDDPRSKMFGLLTELGLPAHDLTRRSAVANPMVDPPATGCNEACWTFIGCLGAKCPMFRAMAAQMPPDYSCLTTNCMAEFTAGQTGAAAVGACIAMGCTEQCRAMMMP